VRNPFTATDPTGKFACPKANTYSSGCANNCKDYSTLAAAITACEAIPNQCNAITFSAKTSGGSSSSGAYNGTWGYQLRASN
jgi:hypothetical protein